VKYDIWALDYEEDCRYLFDTVEVSSIIEAEKLLEDQVGALDLENGLYRGDKENVYYQILPTPKSLNTT